MSTLSPKKHIKKILKKCFIGTKKVPHLHQDGLIGTAMASFAPIWPHWHQDVLIITSTASLVPVWPHWRQYVLIDTNIASLAPIWSHYHQSGLIITSMTPVWFHWHQYCLIGTRMPLSAPVWPHQHQDGLIFSRLASVASVAHIKVHYWPRYLSGQLLAACSLSSFSCQYSQSSQSRHQCLTHI